MKKTILRTAAVACLALAATLTSSSSAWAQASVLTEIYGRGVHAYNAGQYVEAYDLLSKAIDNGLQDPRAYYFRGMVAQVTGRPEAAEADWRTGAQIEATRQLGPEIGRSLSPIQGPARLELEAIRRDERLEALINAEARSQARYGEIEAAQDRAARPRPANESPSPGVPQAADAPSQPAAPPRSVTPPPAPPVANDNPFADDVAGQEPTLESEDALDGALDAAPTPPAAPAADAPAGGDGLFGGDAAGGETPVFPGPASGGGDDPFATPPADSADPFATPPADAADDPFATPPADDADDPFAF